jgi:hypothetical protein
MKVYEGVADGLEVWHIKVQFVMLRERGEDDGCLPA